VGQAIILGLRAWAGLEADTKTLVSSCRRYPLDHLRSDRIELNVDLVWEVLREESRAAAAAGKRRGNAFILWFSDVLSREMNRKKNVAGETYSQKGGMVRCHFTWIFTRTSKG
jgi:hypothetical protein